MVPVAALVLTVVVPMVVIKVRDLFRVALERHETREVLRRDTVPAYRDRVWSPDDQRRADMVIEVLRLISGERFRDLDQVRKATEIVDLVRDEEQPSEEPAPAQNEERPPAESPLFPLVNKLVDRFNTRLAVQVVITVVGLVGGGYIILSGNYSGGMETTSGGIIGMVFGYWLK
jgi:hypothetical protein